MDKSFTRDAILEKLRALKPRFEELNIKRMALFGSYARDEAGPESDVDLLYELADLKGVGVFDVFDIRFKIEDYLGQGIDFVPMSNIHPFLKKRILREKIDV